jgi:hypothetical protein
MVALVAVAALVGAVLAAPFWLPTASGANIAAVSVGTGTVSGFATGDVNRDGTVNSLDALVILQVYAGLTAPWLCCPDNSEALDVNGDGLFNSIDAVLVLQFSAGLIPNL